jgi:predicted metalloprotease with PDZ domain
MATVTKARPRFRALLIALGIAFAALTVFYSATWMYYIQRPSPVPEVEVGFDESYSSSGIEIQNVPPNSPAEESGLKPNDRIVAINGSRADSGAAWNDLMARIWRNSHPGDTVTLTLQRPGQAQPVVITPRFRGLPIPICACFQGFDRASAISMVPPQSS